MTWAAWMHVCSERWRGMAGSPCPPRHMQGLTGSAVHSRRATRASCPDGSQGPQDKGNAAGASGCLGAGAGVVLWAGRRGGPRELMWVGAVCKSASLGRPPMRPSHTAQPTRGTVAVAVEVAVAVAHAVTGELRGAGNKQHGWSSAVCGSGYRVPPALGGVAARCREGTKSSHFSLLQPLPPTHPQPSSTHRCGCAMD